MKYALLILAAAAVLSSCSKHKTEEKKAAWSLSDTMQHMITFDSVRTCNIQYEVTLNGQVASNENSVVKVFPRASGQVLQSPPSLGDHVTKGQVLATIRSADVAGSFSDLNSSNADLAISKRQMENQAALYKNGIASEREYNEAKENYQKALAARAKVQSAINITSGGTANASGTYTITSPIDGYIVEKKIAAGNFIRSDAADNLFTISNLHQVWVQANVYEGDIPKVKEGYSVRVYSLAYPDKVFYGKIDRLSEVLDPLSKALRARVTIDNSEMLLKPDMYARIVVNNTQAQQALCIPTAALLDEDGKKYVIIYNSPSDLKVSEVDIIKTTEDKAYIRSGVSFGQRLVTKYQNLVFAELMNE